MLLDTSILIEISRQEKSSPLFLRVKELVSYEQIFASIIQLAEVADWSVRNNLPVVEEITAVKEFAQMVPLDERICENAAEIKKKRLSSRHRDFGLVDAVILATARSVNQRLLTIDPHFVAEDDCIVLKGRIIRKRQVSRVTSSSRSEIRKRRE